MPLTLRFRATLLLAILFSFVPHSQAGDLIASDGARFRILRDPTRGGWVKILRCRSESQCPSDSQPTEITEALFNRELDEEYGGIRILSNDHFEILKEIFNPKKNSLKLTSYAVYAAGGGCMTGTMVGTIVPLIGNGVGCVVGGIGAGTGGGYIAYKKIRLIRDIYNWLTGPPESADIFTNKEGEKILDFLYWEVYEVVSKPVPL